MGEKDLLNELQSDSNLKDGRVQPHIYTSTKHLDDERFQYNFNSEYEVMKVSNSEAFEAICNLRYFTSFLMEERIKWGKWLKKKCV